jgi:putative drug exporter of the RND superfamily
MTKSERRFSLTQLLSSYPWWGGKLVTEYWYWVVAVWLVIIFVVRAVAPGWNTITADGDLMFLPKEAPSTIGRFAIEDAFPGSQSRSQMMLVLSRDSDKLTPADLAVGLDAARRLHWMAARNAWKQLENKNWQPITPETESNSIKVATSASKTNRDKQEVLLSMVQESLLDNLKQLVEIESDLAVFVESASSQTPLARQVGAHRLLATYLQKIGNAENAAIEADLADLIEEQKLPKLSDEVPEWAKHVHDIFTWRNRVVGHKLTDAKGHTRLIAIELDTEFMATANIELMHQLELMLGELKKLHASRTSSDLRLEVTGSAAIGADVLRASASGLRTTEIVTVVLVLGILITVYRSPLLVAIPILSIIVSLVVSTGVVALLARDPANPASWGLGVFTTTRIFIVVLLFGSGTDFCLFLLARNQELLENKPAGSRQQLYRILAAGWRSVHMALIISAATTIVGLSLMWFSRFEKFQFSGPVIAICLAVTLCVCLTLTPAILSGLGKIAFWPNLQFAKQSMPRTRKLWEQLAGWVVTHPLAALSISSIALSVPAAYGLMQKGNITYDLTAELSENSPSRRGERLLQHSFSTNHGSPLTLIITKPKGFESEEQLREECRQLTELLYLPGVESVRSLTDPLGDYPPGKSLAVSEKDSWRKLVLTNHRITRKLYVSSVAELNTKAAKFDLILVPSPFSLDAAAVVQLIQTKLTELTGDPKSDWYKSQVAISGTAIGISDLRSVTQADQVRIQVLVTLGVWLVLVILLRGWLLPTYLMLTVLVSYYATLGTTQWFFSWLYGAEFHGLDWKVPLFLFVILVAVGQDYNVYLVSRIQEEQQKYPLREGVRRALYMTGGIITSCGVIMAGTFVAMMSPAIHLWLAGIFPQWFSDQIPVLRGITELGFALSFGILLDTILIRSILVPAFIVLWQSRGETVARQAPATDG